MPSYLFRSLSLSLSVVLVRAIVCCVCLLPVSQLAFLGVDREMMKILREMSEILETTCVYYYKEKKKKKK